MNNRNLTNKQLQLQLLAEAAWENSNLQQLANGLSINKKEFVCAFIRYNTDIGMLENEVYSSLPIRLVMHALNQYVPGTWHHKRQQETLKFLSSIMDREIVLDIGFGVPQEHLFTLLNDDAVQSIVLADKFEAAFCFAKTCIEQSLPHVLWEEKIDIQRVEFDTDFHQIQHLVKSSSVIIAHDSIEHSKEPHELFGSVSIGAKEGTDLILCMPLGNPIQFGFHHIGWDNASSAISWIKAFGWSIRKTVVINMNPEIDLFAQDLELVELLVWAQKRP